jgi:hypothetical protein
MSLFSHGATPLASIDFVKWCYSSLLDRPIDDGGLDQWVALLALHPQTTRFVPVSSLMMSEEFFTAHAAINRRERLQKLRKVYQQLDAGTLTCEQFCAIAYKFLLNRPIDAAALAHYQDLANKGKIWKPRVFFNIFKSAEYRRAYQRIKPFLRLHHARQAWVRQLPPARRILDIGGSSPAIPEGALIELGYTHRPQQLIIFDKPPHEQFWGNPDYEQGAPRQFDWGEVQYIHGYAEDLLQHEGLRNEKFDMIFMGQVVEHIKVDALPTVFAWIRDHLTPEGRYFFDTPNRLITEVQMGQDTFIDPDHKKEYTPQEIKTMLVACGFSNSTQTGILEMPHVQATQTFGVEDYYSGQLICDDASKGYCFGTATTVAQ